MAEAGEYKPTLFDRHGPSAVLYLRAWGYGLLVFGMVVSAVMLRFGIHWWVFAIGIVAGAACGAAGWLLGESTGRAWKTLAVDGTSTPYVEQYSYQQALVMQGRVDEALESFEQIIAEQPHAVGAQIKAAELYVKERRNFTRAAELFRGVQRNPVARPGEDVYATNRLVDLLIGPLNDRGRALVELRHLVERYPNTPAADNARRSLRALKAGEAEPSR